MPSYFLLGSFTMNSTNLFIYNENDTLQLHLGTILASGSDKPNGYGSLLNVEHLLAVLPKLHVLECC